MLADSAIQPEDLAAVATSGNYNDLTNKPNLNALREISTHDDFADFPSTGEFDKVYISLETGKIYYWNGSGYTELTDETAVWGQISGNLANQTDLNNLITARTTVATQNQVDDNSSGTIAVTPSTLRIKRQSNNAFIAGDLSGNTRGADAIDIQGKRTNSSQVASGSNSSAIGSQNTASGIYSSAFGYNNTASGYRSSVVGNSNTASGDLSTAVGYQNTIGGGSGSAFGYSNSTTGGSTAVGYQNTASNYSASVGTNNISTSFSSAFGNENTATGDGSSAFGYINTASGHYSSAFGHRANATTLNSVVVGRSLFTHTTGLASVNIGILNNSNGGTLNTTTGAITGSITANTSQGRLTTSVGIKNTTNGDFATAIGYQNTAGDARSSAFGYSNTASGYRSSAVGYDNTANDNASSAFGYGNTASSDGSLAFGCNNTASNDRSSAFGYNNTSSGYHSYAFGGNNTVSGYYSSAVGYLNTASGYRSSVIGYSNTASGIYSSAIGNSNTASGTYSSAIGCGNTASGNNSSAIGYKSRATIAHECSIGGAEISGEFASTSSIFNLKAKTTNSTPVIMSVGDGSNSLQIPTNSVLALNIQVVGRDITTGDVNAYFFKAYIKNIGGTTSMSGDIIKDSLEDDSSWDCNISANNTNDTLVITVTGDASNTVQWGASINSTKLFSI